MPETNLPPALVTEISRTVSTTSQKITRLSQSGSLAVLTGVQELYDVLKTATHHVATLLNAGTPANRLPSELLTRIADLTVENSPYKYTEQVISLTHVCRYRRTVILSYPRIWSTIHMAPGNPMFICESLARSQKLPLTLFMEFTDTYEHPPCRYRDSVTTALDVPDELRICLRHRAVLALDQLLPHRSRIHNINLLLNVSDPDWENWIHGQPILLGHQFFSEGLQNLQRLDFCAVHLEGEGLTITIPASLFAMHLPRLKELKYLGVSGGLMSTVVDLTSCEIGESRYGNAERAGLPVIRRGELRTLLNNNKTLESLTINERGFLDDSSQVPVTFMTDLKFLKVDCSASQDLETAVDSILAPQFKCLDTVSLSLNSPADIQVVATDGSDHTFTFQLCIPMNVHPLRRFGAEIVTLRLGEGVYPAHYHHGQTLRDFFGTLDTLRVSDSSEAGSHPRRS